MTSESRTRVEDLFHRLAPLPTEERRRILDREVAEADVRRRVDELLAAHDDGSVLDKPPTLSPVDELGRDPDEHDLVGTVLGRYHVLEVLGSGGMGAVCLAEQREPVRRPVAVKIIRNGMLGPDMLLRFEREAQALALLSSPHVATLLDAGTTEEGAPYLVMEYVDGIAITTYCAEARLDRRARLELFLQMCDGLEHANLRGVIHRDIKPSNVLVTTESGRPWVKIIDFGISKIVDARAPRGRAITSNGAVIGTPEYMSPEQREVDPHDPDGRTDVFSAGAVLYELLLDEPLLRAADSHGEAPRPASVTKRLPRPLARIVLQAIEHDRTRRYPTVGELASACRHYLKRTVVLSRRVWIAVTILGVLALGVGAAQRLVWTRGRPIAAVQPGQTRTLRIPGDYPTIQQGLDAASSGDVVLVSPGTYRENLTMREGVILESVGGPDATTIDGSMVGRVVDFVGVSSATVLRGFRLTHGAAQDGGGIRCWKGASPIIENNFVTENTAAMGGGIAARYESFPTIRGNRIHANYATAEGGGIYAVDGKDGTLWIQSNEIWGNRAGPGPTSTGGGIWVGGIDTSIRQNRISQNSAASSGGGIWAGFAGKKTITGNLLSANTSLRSGGGIFADQGTASIAENVLQWNGAPEAPGIFVGSQGEILLRENVDGTGD